MITPTRVVRSLLLLVSIFFAPPALADCLIGAPDCVGVCPGYSWRGADETSGFYAVGSLGGHQRLGADYADNVRGAGPAFDGALGLRFNRLLALEGGFFLGAVADTTGSGETDNYVLRFDAKITPIIYPAGRVPYFRPYLLLGGSPYAGFSSNNGNSFEGWSVEAGGGFEMSFPDTPFFFDASGRYQLIRYNRFTDNYGNVSPTAGSLSGDDLALVVGFGIRFGGWGRPMVVRPY